MFHQTSICSLFVATRSKRTILKCLVLLIFGFAVLLYIIDFSSLRLLPLKFPLTFGNGFEENRKWDWKFVEDMNEEDKVLYKSYFINTEGCRMPSFKVFDDNVKKYLLDIRPIQCGGKPLVRSNNNYLWIDLNVTEIESTYDIDYIDELQCEYQPFRRKNDFENEYPKPSQKVRFKFGDVVRVPEEFIRVICRVLGRKKAIYEDYHFFTKNKKTTTESLNHKTRMANDDNNNDSEKNKSNEPINVMVIGIDSVSRLNFHRRMNETADVLLNNLKAIEMFGFNKVADNTYPNLVPTLTGLDENELITACIPTENDTYDRCNFIWKTFKEKNFTTAFVEDNAALGLFQYLRRGFKDQPTDYSMRPILIEMEHHTAKQKQSNTFLCMGKRRTFDVFFEYVQKFITSMTDRLHFSFFWSASYTHDYLNMPVIIDSDLAEFLSEMQISGALDNLFLILMSDHGLRWGGFRSTYQGMVEERQPFLFFIPPKRFAERYPEAMRNLVRNRRRLITHFDLYETLRDLADLKTLESNAIRERAKDLKEADPLPRGISAFLPIPSSRSCYDAAISAHWCTCHERFDLPATDPRVSEVARLIVSEINALIKPYPQCRLLRLNSVFNANLGTSNENFRNVTNNFVDVTVRLQTRPGLGEFEATARIHENNNFELTGTVSRTNLYGKQSYCIDDYKLKLYCFCDKFQ
ncbi:uncharacterized protein LOC116340686 isoform X2 [Contarinia nasturtii]|nr:uncharacterized protein LOC116340686 isoform X2 [Contarinia nasturtii]XP_031623163.1 uncharacterized protein LOC116340686 isoform X2 [Contarinia nasturtii]